MSDESKCRKKELCEFQVSRDLPDAQIEACINCGKKVVYYKKGGRVNNEKYLADHKRDFVQPYGKDKKLFIKLYGLKRYSELTEREAKRTKEQIEADWEQTRRDAVRRVKRQVV